MPDQSDLSRVLIITSEIRNKAIALMPVAQSSAENEEIRHSFFKTSQSWLKLRGYKSFSETKKNARRAQKRLESLFMIARGVTEENGHRITVECWEEILDHFKQNLRLKSPH